MYEFLKGGDSSLVKRKWPKRGVIGVLINQDRLLVVRRAESVSKGGWWCFPGGHLEAGENARVAVRRELQEELGILISPVRRLGSLRVQDSGHVLAVWEVAHDCGEIAPSPLEISEFRWLTPSAIRRIPQGLPSNEQVLRMLGV
ncbi:MAG: NUDIX domain-containing protein [Planctomycetota bacterium]